MRLMSVLKSVSALCTLGSRPLVSSVPAVTQSSVSVTQSLPTRLNTAYPEGSYTASTPMTPHGACLTPSLQQGWVTSPVIYQQPYQNFTPRGLYGNPALCVPLQSQHPQPSPVYVLPPPDKTQQITEALAKELRLPSSIAYLKRNRMSSGEKRKTRQNSFFFFVGVCL